MRQCFSSLIILLKKQHCYLLKLIGSFLKFRGNDTFCSMRSKLFNFKCRNFSTEIICVVKTLVSFFSFHLAFSPFFCLILCQLVLPRVLIYSVLFAFTCFVHFCFSCCSSLLKQPSLLLYPQVLILSYHFLCKYEFYPLLLLFRNERPETESLALALPHLSIYRL